MILWSPHHGRRGLRRSRASGFTFVELAVAMVVALVAVSISSQMVIGMSGQRRTNRENARAAAAVRNVLEAMRKEDFSRVYALYNADGADDPGGANTAPGNRFEVPGLNPEPDAPGGLQGEVFFPTVGDPSSGIPLELREDVLDPVLGTPRDLSGDSIIDGADHSADYFLLPVRIAVRWTGKNGRREFRIATQLCEYRKAP